MFFGYICNYFVLECINKDKCFCKYINLNEIVYYFIIVFKSSNFIFLMGGFFILMCRFNLRMVKDEGKVISKF